VIAGMLAQRMSGVDGAAVTAGGLAIDAAIVEHGVVGAIAGPLYTTYVVPFEITGILLLVAIVGALVLAKKEV
jgi:NADH-quinone oxidoreductase subunit J